jgi:hypothetical protein
MSGSSMRRMSTGVAAVAVAALVLTERSVSADVGGSVAGCHTNYNVKAASAGTFGYENIWTTDVVGIDCGAVRLTTTSPRKVFIDWVDNNNTSSGSLQCEVDVMSWNGLTLLWQGVGNTSATGTGSGNFLFTIPTSVIGYIYIGCAIPKNTSFGISSVSGFNIQ